MPDKTRTRITPTTIPGISALEAHPAEASGMISCIARRYSHLCILALEVSVAVGEGSDLCWAHECEVQRVEEKDNIFVLHTCMAIEDSMGVSGIQYCDDSQYFI